MVVVDTSPFSRFNDVGLALKLSDCLPGAVIPPEVKDELRRAPLSTCAALRLIAKSTGWPTCVALNTQNQRDLLHIAQLHHQPGDHATKNFGEIASVLLARQIGASLLVLDDELGVKLARARGIARLSTAELAANAEIAETLTPAEARMVFLAAAPIGCGEPQWEAARARAKARASTV